MQSVRVLPSRLPLVQHPSARQLLYPHQAAMLDEWENHDSFLLVSKTGTGKTIAGVLPVLKHGLRAICVYPTNELIRDQVRNISGIAEREGLRVCVQTPDTTGEEYASADVILVHIDASRLDEWRRRRHLSKKWRALRDLLEADKPKLVLTNPDILFLIFGLRYHAEPLAQLPGYDALIIDEFHLYSGVELAHALYMVHLGRSLGAFRKVVLMSATPPPEVAEALHNVLGQPLVVDANTTCNHAVVAEREAVREVEITARLASSDVVETAVGVVHELAEDVRRRRSENTAADYVPAVVVVDSVVNAIRLEDRLVEEGWCRQDLAIIRGLSARRVRETAGKLIAIGTSAIEVGIDFVCDYLIFEASEAASFMQRFGRVGRHTLGRAYVLCKSNVLAGIQRLSSPVERGELERRVYDWYPEREARAWFVASLLGLLSALTLTENLVKRVSDDWNGSAEQLATVETQVERIGQTYAHTIGCEARLFARAMAKLRKMRVGDPANQWLAAYRDLNTFRTSLPSEWVLDFAERERRGGEWDAAKYTVDIAALLRRADGLRYNEKIPHPEGHQGMLTVKGYGRYKRVWVPMTFSDEQCGVLYRTAEYPDLCFIQEGHKASVSHVMAMRDHVFVVVPRTAERDLDWRLPVFDCGKHLIAFDGTALLLCELFNRSSTSLKTDGCI